MFGADRIVGGLSSILGDFTELPIASPAGKYLCASVRLTTAMCAQF
jgi:hypothetical protein